jgi:Bacterial regulatory proteins, tetR family
MVRWEPGARERLQAAALELFATRGFEQTTAAEIAQSVGLTERTFFRHFSDKREVLFYGQQQFLQAFIDGVNAAPSDASPIEVIASALHAAASFFPDERRPYSRTRQSVIDQNPRSKNANCTNSQASPQRSPGPCAREASASQRPPLRPSPVPPYSESRSHSGSAKAKGGPSPTSHRTYSTNCST